MGETIRYTDSRGNVFTFAVAGKLKYLDGTNLEQWQVSPVWEQAYDHSTLYGYGTERRTFDLRFMVTTDTYDNVRGTIGAMRRALLADASHSLVTGTAVMGTLEVILDNGGTYSVTAAVAMPKIENPQRRLSEVTLSFQANSPWWRYGAQASAGSAFDGTTPVSVDVNNAGEVYTWPAYVVTGSIDTPRITDSVTGRYIEIGTVTAADDDVLRIYTNPPLIEYVAGGTAPAVKWTGYAGTVSHFFPLSVGAGTLTLSASDGTATWQATWDVMLGGLGQ